MSLIALYPFYARATTITQNTAPAESITVQEVAVATTTPVDLYSLTVEELIVELATRYDVSTSTALNIACAESRFNAGIKNPNSSAGGVFQFINSTWASYSTRYWGEVRNKYDRVQNVELAIRVIHDSGTHDWNASRYYWSTNPYESGKCK